MGKQTKVKTSEEDIDQAVREEYDKNFNTENMKMQKMKAIKYTFIFVTIIFVGIAFGFYKWGIGGTEFLTQLFMGISTGCLVCALQEVVRIEELKIEIGHKEKIKQKIEKEKADKKIKNT